MSKHRACSAPRHQQITGLGPDGLVHLDRISREVFIAG